MSENPYQAPLPNPQTAIDSHPTNKAPTGLKLICIACIVFGGLGSFGSVLGVGVLLFQEQFAEFQTKFTDPSQHEMQAKMTEIQTANFIPNMFLVICNIFIGLFLLVGGVGILTKKRWGQNILSRALIAAMIFVLVRIVVTSFQQIKVFEVMKETVMDQMPAGGQAGGPAEETMQSIIMASMYFGVAVSVVMALIFAAFYFWGWRYLKRDSCQEYLSTFPQQ